MPGIGTVIPHPSPNFGPRRDGLTPELVVIHYTALPLAEALDWLTSPEREVSAHYLIARDGRLFRLVDEDQRAWHAGRGSWGPRIDVNSCSIGIELENCGASPFAAPQMDRLEHLLADLLSRYSLPPDAVIGHSDLAPGRKRDPGPRFDWARLERMGLAAPRGTGPAPTTADPAAFRRLARAAGYTAEVDDATLLAAIRLRYRPGADGPLCPEDFTPLIRKGWT